MASIGITITGLGDTTGTGFAATAQTDALRALENIVRGVKNGAVKASSVVLTTSATNAVAATSDVTATTSGSLGVVINGTTVTTTFSVSQDGTATNAVADINANSTVNKFVRASKGATGHLTLTAVVPGAIGNCCTVTVTGTGAAATGSGKLTGGTGVDGAPTTYSL